MPPYRDDRAGPRVTPGLPRLRCARRPDALSREAKRPPACRRPFGAARSRRRSGAAEGEAVAAVNGLAARGADGDRCLLAAVGAARGERLAGVREWERSCLPEILCPPSGLTRAR